MPHSEFGNIYAVFVTCTVQYVEDWGSGVLYGWVKFSIRVDTRSGQVFEVNGAYCSMARTRFGDDVVTLR